MYEVVANAMVKLDVALTATERASGCLRQLDEDRHYQSRTSAAQIRRAIEDIRGSAWGIVAQLAAMFESEGRAWTGNAEILK